MRRVELAVLLVLALTGCASVPTTGPVQHFQPQQGGPTSGVQVAPLPPVDGATQLLIVEGFLHAMGTYQTNYNVARQYLTDQAAKGWHPESGVQVYADGYPPAETDQSVVLIAPLAGTVDASGTYLPATGQVRLDFELVKNDAGQWRISNPPAGLLVSKYLFTTGFLAIDAYFVSAAEDVVIPDPRFVPVAEVGYAMAANDVLAGPTPWLAPLVAARSWSDVHAEAVSVDSSGLAHVKLSGNASALSTEQRERLLTELTLTLCGFGRVRAVQVSAGGAAWATADGRSELTPSSFPTLDPAGASVDRPAFLISGDRLRRQLSLGNWSDFVEVQTGVPRVIALAVSRNSQTWAGVTQDQTRVISGPIDGKDNRAVRTGTRLLRPQFSRSGELWSPAAKLSDLRVLRQGAAVRVSMSGVPTGEVVAAALAPDGHRLALVVAHDGMTTVGLLRVRRSENAIVLDAWRQVGLDSGVVGASRILDVGWSSASDLALLRVNAEMQTSVGVVSQDGAVFTEIGPGDAAGLRSITAAPGRPTLATAVSGTMYRYDGEFNWAVAGTAVDAVSYPG